MIFDERPLDTLRSIAERRGTGELICASASAEVHVFLQHGRVAWATDSQHPFAFTRYLQKIADIDPDSFRDILDSCRREKRPLGETLVSWGVASWEDVRQALRHQIELAIDVLRGGGPAQTVFLDRTEQFAQYDSELTFEIEGLLPNVAAFPARTPPREEYGPASALPAQYARRLFDSVEGIVWAELLEGKAVIDSAPEPPMAEARAPCGGRFDEEILKRTVLDGTELVAIRAPEGTLAGVALSPPRSLWCRLTPDATVGAAVSELSAYRATDRACADSETSSERGTPWAIGANETIAMNALRDFLSRAPETLAALITELGDGPWSCGLGSALPAEYALDLVRRRVHALAVPTLFEDRRSPESVSADVGFRFRTILTRERRVWCFGAEIGTRRRRILWLLLDRRSSQGLGWAYLTSLSRQLLHLRGWEGHG